MLGALFGFKGRLSRPGYWEVLASIALIDVALLLGRMTVADSGLPGGLGPQSPLCQAMLHAAPWAMVIFTAWSLLAAAVKRLHDRDRTGFLILVALIPVIGWLWLLIDLFILEGTEGKNRYGRPPHAPPPEARSQFSWDAEPAAPAVAPSVFEAPAHSFQEAHPAPPAPAEEPTTPEPADGEHGRHAQSAPAADEAHADVQEAAQVHAEPEPGQHADASHGVEASQGHEAAQAHDQAPSEAHADVQEDPVLDVTSDPGHAQVHAAAHAPALVH